MILCENGSCREVFRDYCAQATKLQAAENDLKQMMADVARAVEKAQEAVARITPKAAVTTTETQLTTSSR